MNASHWQKRIIGLFQRNYVRTVPVPGDSGSVHEGTVVFRDLDGIWQQSEPLTLRRCQDFLEEQQAPFGLVCFYRDESGNLVLQIFPPSKRVG